jgi:stress response protein YsnF
VKERLTKGQIKNLAEIFIQNYAEDQNLESSVKKVGRVHNSEEDAPSPLLSEFPNQNYEEVHKHYF